MLNSKKLTSAVLIAALASSSLVVAPHAVEAKTFNDVPKSHWAYSVIDEISNAKVMNGTAQNVFSPKKLLTRAEFTAILYNMAPDKSNGNGATNFTDVPDNVWYKDAAYWGVSNGIIFNQNNKFNGNVSVTREYMADMIYKYMNRYYPDALDKSEYDAKFTDANKFSGDYLLETANILAHNNLIVGVGSHQFAPKATLTRAEAAAMASRIMHFVDENNPVVPPEKPEQPEQPQEPEKPPVKPEEPQQPVDPKPEQPQKPEKPPVEESKPYPGDENAPEWMIKIGVRGQSGTIAEYTYITKPNDFSREQWEALKVFYKDKERPSFYNQVVPYNVDAQSYMNTKLERLYSEMQKAKAKEALEAGTVQLSSEEQKMIDLVNEERRKAGVPELKVSPKLCEAAKIRAEESTIRPDHTRPNGTMADTILDDVGLTYYKTGNSSDLNSIAFGENQVVGKNQQVSVQIAFSGLMNSSSHKDNMLNDIHLYIGVSHVQMNGNSAWIQTFGRLQ